MRHVFKKVGLYKHLSASERDKYRGTTFCGLEDVPFSLLQEHVRDEMGFFLEEIIEGNKEGAAYFYFIKELSFYTCVECLKHPSLVLLILQEL